VTGGVAAEPRVSTRDPGVIVTALVGLLLLTAAATIDLPKAAGNFKGDEATYYVLANSLARDFDFTFERRDLIRVWEEFRGGPEGIFLKRGKVNQIRSSDRFPYLRRVKLEDPIRTRLYYAKSFIYPLCAAPFVLLFGTHGFLIFHALLLTLDLWLVYLFLRARSGPTASAIAYAVVFLFASVMPIYFVWLTPELFNVSLVLVAFFLWSYKEVARPEDKGRAWLFGPRSDYLAAVLIGVLTFSKLPHALLMAPLVLLAVSRRQWGRAIGMSLAWAIVAGGLFTTNAAISGEFNYQAGDRKTFYGRDGFPFANERETFENIGPVRGRDTVMVGDVLVNRHSLEIFRRNIGYFVFGRFCGLLPYFFPGVLSAALFVTSRRRDVWQWLNAGTILLAVVSMLIVWPFTYSGGGGPVGNRYFLSFYPLFLFLTPPLGGVGAAAVALGVGGVFTAQILLNPILASLRPGDHTKTAPLRWLPIELTLLHDLPMAFNPDRSRLRYTGSPPMLMYLPDDNAYPPEGDRFWVRGKSRTEIVLRGPVADAGGNRYVSKTISRLTVDVTNGAYPSRVTISTGADSRTLTMKTSEAAHFDLAMPSGVPYHRDENPTSYLYLVSIANTAGFVPFLEAPPSSDARFLGAQFRLLPQYADAETTIWSAPAGNR